MALALNGVCVDVIGGDESECPQFHVTPNVSFLNFGGCQVRSAGVTAKSSRLVRYYARLIRYAATAKPKIFHILWHHKFERFEHSLLLLYYKALGKKLAFTAHNVNRARRDSKDSRLNRLALKIQYRLIDHIFVHTQKMKAELIDEFGVREQAVTVIRYPIDNAFPDTDITPAEAKRRLGLKEDERAILFFGKIRPYKGIEQLLAAFRQLVARQATYRLIIAGEPIEDYLTHLGHAVKRDFSPGQIIPRMQFIPDEDVELYLKAADVLVLPYREIFQSGILVLAYRYGLPVVATDVGSFREDILEGRTGFVCRPDDPLALAEAVEMYFASDLYKNLKTRRQEIRAYANAQYSANAAAALTRSAYAQLLGRDSG